VDVSSESEIRVRSVVLLYLLSDADPTTPNVLTSVDDLLVKDGEVWRLSNRVTSVLSRRG
jgi:hypothetical protein